MNKNDYIAIVEETLIKQLEMKTNHKDDPIEVLNTPKGWKCIGTGNYAAVFIHEQKNDWVVKVYAKNKEKLAEEASVYRKIEKHPNYAELISEGRDYLILTRIEGITLYDAIINGKRIPKKVINDVNVALEYAKEKGLNPNDVHLKNIIMKDGHGYIIDIAEFDKKESDTKWEDFVNFYDSVYQYTLYLFPVEVPADFMNKIRKGYRLYQGIKNIL